MVDTYSDLTNLRGPAARIVSVDAEALPAGSEPTIEMTGPDQGRMFMLGIPAGMPASEAVPQDGAVGGFIGTAGTDSQQATDARVYQALGRTTAPVRRIEDGVDGVVGGTTVDNTAAIQQIINEAGRGGTVVLGNPGPSRTFRIDSTLTLTAGQQRIVGGGRDQYSSSLWTSAPIVMMDVQSSGVILEDLGFSTHLSRAATQATAVNFLGSPDADIDAEVHRCSFYQVDRALVMRGKNLKVTDSLFSNSKTGIYVAGKDAAYHSASYESRGLVAASNRFHSMGETNADAGILISPESKHMKSQIMSNHFDMFGLGRHVAVIGADISNRHEAIHLAGNTHVDTVDAAVYFDQVTRSKIEASMIYGASAGMTNAAVNITNAVQIDANGLQIIRHNDGMYVAGVNFVALRAISTANHLANGIRFGTSASNVMLDGVMAHSNIGWGLTGSAALGTPRQGFVAAFSNTGGQTNPILGLA